jgi:hypothetical protein
VIVYTFLAIVAFGGLYCLFTGLNPLNRRRWYDRVWRLVSAAALLGYLLLILLFADS